MKVTWMYESNLDVYKDPDVWSNPDIESNQVMSSDLYFKGTWMYSRNLDVCKSPGYSTNLAWARTLKFLGNLDVCKEPGPPGCPTVPKRNPELSQAYYFQKITRGFSQRWKITRGFSQTVKNNTGFQSTAYIFSQQHKISVNRTFFPVHTISCRTTTHLLQSTKPYLPYFQRTSSVFGSTDVWRLLLGNP